MVDAEDYSSLGAPDAHAPSHEKDGDDEVDITGLTPAAHGPSHEKDGDDEIDASGLTGVTVFVDRGDPSGFDLEDASMTLDGTYRDWDVSSIVPAGAIALELLIRQRNNNSGKELAFRKNGNTNTKNALSHMQIVAGAAEYWGGMVSCDANRVIEYAGSSIDADWTNIQILVRGWYI